MANEIEINVRVNDQTRDGNNSARRGSDDLTRRVEQNNSRSERSMGILGRAGQVAGTALKAGAVVGAAGVGLLTGFIAEGVKGAISYEVLAKKTAAVIKSTGAAAGVTAKHVQEMAGELEAMSGVDEELIIQSQNVLMTFTGIKNVGKDKIFDMATQSALDMSVALGTDMQGAAIQVGKALNDPIKGVTALSKVGVSFTAQQKEQIKTMVAAGDTMGAQKLILAELNKEFGGQAKAAGDTFAGSWARAQDALADTGREIGQSLLPTLTDLADWAAEKIPEAVDATKKAWNDFVAAFNGKPLNDDAISDLGSELRAVKDSWSELMGVFDSGTDDINGASKALDGETKSVAGLFAAIGASVADIGSYLRTAILAVQEFGEQVSMKALSAVHNIQDHFGGLPGPVGKKFRQMAAETKEQMDVIQGKIDRTNTKQLQGQLSDAQTKLRRLGQQKPTPKIKADIKEAEAKIARIRSRLNGVRGKTVTVHVNTQYATYGDKGGHYEGGTFVKNKGTGGITGAATGGARGGWTMVGEYGRELVRLPFGSQVKPHGATEAMAGKAAEAARTVLELRSGGSRLDDLLVEIIRKSIRARGGNVQTVLGS